MKKNNVSSSETKTYKQMAIELLNKNGKDRFYVMHYRDLDCDTPHSYYKKLTDEQLAEVKNVVAQCEAEEIEMWEYFDNDTVPEYLAVSEPFVCEAPSTVELDTPYYGCDIRMAVFYDGLSKAPKVVNTQIVLSQQMYVELLEWQLNNRRSGYNDLRYSNLELFKAIDELVRFKFSFDGLDPLVTPAYAVELTGVQEDALTLCGEPGVELVLSYAHSDESSEASTLKIEDRVLSFQYEAWDSQGGWTQSFNIENVDAIAVENMLAVDNYEGIIEVMKERFCGKEGFDRFVELLDKNSIDYTGNSCFADR